MKMMPAMEIYDPNDDADLHKLGPPSAEKKAAAAAEVVGAAEARSRRKAVKSIRQMDDTIARARASFGKKM